jgi:hypothetical protein
MTVMASLIAELAKVHLQRMGGPVAAEESQSVTLQGRIEVAAVRYSVR